MRSILFLATGALGMVTIAHALPALVSTTTDALHTAERTAGTINPGSNSLANTKISDKSYSVLQKRVKPHRVKVEVQAGSSGSRGGGLPADTADEWIEAAQKALADISCNKGTILNGPHSGGDSSSADQREHITVQPEDGGSKMHVYFDGTYTRSKVTHKKGRKGGR
ncbi:hypothetical protein PgNI_06567 [Pyricularia grisea]|uniref:Uncharacterized protein n=1 Tax=Pyricularia grisea TaxID=148305 RepID=A0A6P8B466_PYRGI|nr:hypothetical protein PgNI_06567 [Pyricularia grisea]TLD09929.1 hypothetical protein PgNI_06567 [Pyricularia grisea]